ncbi:hypothetical protein Q8A73_000239 [Channa argus]|nr:hypothetical protein Q8A73_000239 [Channa argus]
MCPETFPDIFVIVSVLDGVQVHHCDCSIKKAELKQDWVQKEKKRVKQVQLLTVTVNSGKHFNLFTTKHSSPTFYNITYILFIIIIIFTIIIFTIVINREFKLQFRKIHNFILILH